MALVLLHSAQHTDTHLVCATVELQAFLVLWADLPVQMSNLIHQLVSFEGCRLIVRFQVFLTVRCQAHQARLNSFELLPDADVACHIPGAGVVVVRRRGSWRRGLRKLLGRRTARRHQAAWCRPLVVADPALWAQVLACVVSVVPVGLEADGTEEMTTWNRHGVPQILFAEVADVLLMRHRPSNSNRSRLWPEHKSVSVWSQRQSENVAPQRCYIQSTFRQQGRTNWLSRN